MRCLVGPFLAVAFLAGCEERELGLTERDAVALGYVQVECTPQVTTRVYVESDSVATAEYCQVIVDAHRAAVASDVASASALSFDSLSVIVVWLGYYGELPNQPTGPDYFFDVTFDVQSDDGNVRVILDRPVGDTEVWWAPEGLRY